MDVFLFNVFSSETPQLQMAASGDSSDMESDSSTEIVNPGSGVSNVEDAVVSSGDTDDINTSVRSNNPLVKSLAESQAETETSSGDVASVIYSRFVNIIILPIHPSIRPSVRPSIHPSIHPYEQLIAV